MGRHVALVWLLSAGQGIVLAQQVDFVEQVPLDLGDLQWNYVGPRTAQPDGVLYEENTQSGFFSPLGRQWSLADDIHFNVPVNITGFTVGWVSRTTRANLPITMTVSFIENDADGNRVGQTFGRSVITGLGTGVFLTSVTLQDSINTTSDIWMRVQFSTNIGRDTGQLIGADLNNHEGGNAAPSHDWFLVYDDVNDVPLSLFFGGGYTPNLPTTDPNYTLPGNFILTVTGSNMEPNVTVVIKGSAPCSPFNRDSHGVLPVKILGSPDFDVSMVDIRSLRISRSDGVGGSAQVNRGHPSPSTTQSGDDLNVHFNADRVVGALKLGPLAEGDQVELCMTGILLDSPTPFLGCDCVVIIPPGPTGPNMLTVNSNLPGAYGQFYRTYPLSTDVTFTAEEFYLGQRFVGWKFNGEFLSRDMSTVVTVAGNNANGKTVDAVFRRTGDITGDEAINLNDFAMFAVCFGRSWGNNIESACSNEALASSDLDRNGVIDLRDFAIFAVHFGT